MPKLIKDSAIVEDGYQVISDKTIESADQLPEGNLIVHIDVWQAVKDTSDQKLGVWLDNTDSPEPLASACKDLDVIAVNFPVFTDGRGYSYAHILRGQYGYEGELRAIGDVLMDQLSYMTRVGFNSFAMREDQNLEKSLDHMKDFTTPYQAAIDNTSPLFRAR